MRAVFHHSLALLAGLLLMGQAGAELTLARTVLWDGAPAESVPAGLTLTVSLEVTATGAGAVTGLAVEEILPAGWRLVGVGGANPPQVAPNANSEGTLFFLWYDVPAFPATFSYTVQTPAEVYGLASLSGRTLHRLRGGELAGTTLNTAIETYEPDCSPRITAEGPQGIWVIPDSLPGLEATLSSAVQAEAVPGCAVPDIQVEYFANGEPLGSTAEAPDYALDTVLPGGAEYVLTARAVDAANGTEAEVSWTVVVHEAGDTEPNGFPDDPFGALSLEGARWLATVPESALTAQLLRFGPSDGMLPDLVSLSAANPLSVGQTVSLEASRSLLNPGEKGILVLATVPAGEVDALVLPGGSSGTFSLPPAGLFKNGLCTLAAVLVQDETGAVRALGEDRLSANPPLLRTQPFSTGDAIYTGYETALDSRYPNALAFTPAGSAWEYLSDSSGVENNVLTAELLWPGVFAPWMGPPPVLVTTPAHGQTLSATLVYPARERRMLMRLKNTGGGEINGVISVLGRAFRLLGDARFRLRGGEQRMVYVVFAPTGPGQYNGTLGITHSAGAPVKIKLQGTSVRSRVSASCGTRITKDDRLGDAAVWALLTLSLSRLRAEPPQ